MSKASDLLYAEEGEAMREALPRCKAAEQTGKTKTILFLATPARIVPIKAADPKAAERAKRYIWSRIAGIVPRMKEDR